MVRREFSDLTNLRYIYESRLGLAHARNAGWRNARGKYVAYLDDDGVACPTWLEKIVDVFETVKPQPGCVGGKIAPIWEAARPNWLTDELLSSLAILDWSDSPVVLDNRQYLAGVNLAFQKDILAEIDGFWQGLDRTGKNLLSSGDVLAERQVQNLGYNCYYDPKIVVHHHISASRLTKEWFRQRFYWQGVSDAILEQILSPSPRHALFKSAIADVFRLVKILTGGHVHPRRIFWNINGIRFPQWLSYNYKAGAARKKLSMAVGYGGPVRKAF